jgi:hypothetical protein
MTPVQWQEIMTVLNLVLSAVSPALKAAAQAELTVLETTYASNPLIVELLTEFGKMIAAA